MRATVAFNGLSKTYLRLCKFGRVNGDFMTEMIFSCILPKNYYDQDYVSMY